MLKYVIFDFDLTLVNSLPAIIRGLNAMAERFGLARVTEDDVLRVMHLESKELWSGLWGAYDEAWDAFFRQKMTGEEKFYLQTAPGIPELLRRLKAGGRSLGLASNRDHPWEALVSTGLAPYFDTAVGALDVPRGKPAPDMLLLALEQLKADRDQAVYIGDAPTDMLAAARAGLRGIGFTQWTGLPPEDLLAAGAWEVRASLADLADLLFSFIAD